MRVYRLVYTEGATADVADFAGRARYVDDIAIPVMHLQRVITIINFRHHLLFRIRPRFRQLSADVFSILYTENARCQRVAVHFYDVVAQ